MIKWIQNKKKLVALIVAVVVIISGGIFVVKLIDYNAEKDYLHIGTREKDGISFGREEGNNKKRIEEIRTILDKAKASKLTDETAEKITGKELIFDISHGTYMDASTQIMVELWIQKDGTSIYREALTHTYYTLDKEHTEQLESLLK